MRSASLLLAGGIGLLVLVPGMAAQTLPVPVLPPESPPEPGPTPPPPKTRKEPSPPAAVEATKARPKAWEYALGAGVVWDSNIDFILPEGVSGTAALSRAGIARVLSSSRGELRAEAAGSWVGYPHQERLSRYYVDAGLKGDYQSSTRTKWRGGVHYWLGYTDSSPILIEQGVPLPLAKMDTLIGELGLTQQIGARTSFRVEARVFRVEFEDPAFSDGQSLRGTASLVRRLGAGDELQAAYALESYLYDPAGGSYLTHFGSFQWAHTLSRETAFLLEAGASYTPDAAQVGLSRREGFFGGATFIRRIGRSNLTAFFRREVTPAFGLGVSRLESRAGVQAHLPIIGRDWDLRIAAYHIQPAERVYSSSSDGAAALDRRLGGYFTLSGEVRYRRRGEDSTRPKVSAFQAGLFLTLGSRGRAE